MSAHAVPKQHPVCECETPSCAVVGVFGRFRTRAAELSCHRAPAGEAPHCPRRGLWIDGLERLSIARQRILSVSPCAPCTRAHSLQFAPEIRTDVDKGSRAN